MSHEIENGKRCVLIPADADERFRTFDTMLYLTASAANNVHPRRFDWRVICAKSGLHEWNGQVMLPGDIWDRAGAADGGCIEPWGKIVTGVAYIQSWKRVAAEPLPAFDLTGEPLWFPSIVVYTGYQEHGDETANKVNAAGAALFGEFDADKQHAAFKSLFPEPIRGGYNRATVSTRQQLLDSVYLFLHRSNLPFGFELKSDPDCAYFRRMARELV